MAAFYNAVLRDKNNKIVARTYLTNPQSLPQPWQVHYATQEVVTTRDLERTLCGPTRPLSITRKGIQVTSSDTEQQFTINYFGYWSNKFSVQAKGSTTVRELLEMISRKMGAPPIAHCLSFNGLPVQDEWDSRTLANLGVSQQNNELKHVLSNDMLEALSVPRVIYNSQLVPVPGTLYQIFVKTLVGITVPLVVSAYNTVEDVKWMIKLKVGVSQWQQRLLFGGKQLEDGRTLCHYEIIDDSKLHVVLRLGARLLTCHGSPFRKLDGNAVSGKGVDATKEVLWRSFQTGLNLIGSCTNARCKSNEFPKEDLGIYHVGYGPFTLTSSSYFMCPACKDGFTFKPIDFLVSEGNCLFRFRNSRTDHVTSRELKSGLFPEYKRLGANLEYESMEILTTEIVKSAHYCVACEDIIGWTKDEWKFEDCQHYFHRECVESAKSCPVCATLLVKTIRERGSAVFMKVDLDNFV